MATPTHNGRLRNRILVHSVDLGSILQEGILFLVHVLCVGVAFCVRRTFPSRKSASGARENGVRGRKWSGNGQNSQFLKEIAWSRPKGQRADPAVGQLSAHLGDFQRSRPGGHFSGKKTFSHQKLRNTVWLSVSSLFG